jgi:hypothetical protein
VQADADGTYSFAGMPNGSYSVTPSKNGFAFSPVSQTISLSGTNQTAVNFAAQTISSTWSISGSISPPTSEGGATMMLTGSSSGVVIADANGNYSFSGLANGSYTVTPNKTGFTFAPAIQSVTVNGANQAAVSFIAQGTGPTWSILGTVSPASGGNGATVTLSGAASAGTVADANGNYSFTGLANGSYMVIPARNGYTFNPVNQMVSVSNSDSNGINFAVVAPSNSITLDVNKSQDGTKSSATIASPAFSTAATNELLLTFIATDYISGSNATVSGVSGAGLTWTLVQRTNGQSGTSEIWRAFAPSILSNVTITTTLSQSVVSSLTVMSFAGVSTAGVNGSGAIGAVGGKSAATGGPTATIITTENNSWVMGVGKDFDNAVARTVGVGQTLVHQDLASTGDTYWIQRQTNPIASAGRQ